MNHYFEAINKSQINSKRGGICPYCKMHTGWYVREMGIIPNDKDPKLDKPDESTIASLEHQGYTACKLWTIPGILANECMSCGRIFYDMVHNLSRGTSYKCPVIGLFRIYPQELPSDIPCANPDLPQDCISLYEEASKIFSESPRSSAVILRLCLQVLLNNLGFTGSIYQMIGKASEKLHLPSTTQQFMEIVRFRGNEAAHDSDLEINPDEQKENVAYMFTIINQIATYAITLPQKAQEEYNKLPEAVRNNIEQRNKNP